MSWQTNLPPAPPSPPPTATAAKRPSAVVLVLGVVAFLLVTTSIATSLVLATRRGDSGASGTRGEPATPAPAASSSPSGPGSRQARVKAIIANAHSGRYFSNDFQVTYPPMFERQFVIGAMGSAPKSMSDEYLACTLSYVETNHRASDLISYMKDKATLARLGLKAAAACIQQIT